MAATKMFAWGGGHDEAPVPPALTPLRVDKPTPRAALQQLPPQRDGSPRTSVLPSPAKETPSMSFGSRGPQGKCATPPGRSLAPTPRGGRADPARRATGAPGSKQQPQQVVAVSAPTPPGQDLELSTNANMTRQGTMRQSHHQLLAPHSGRQARGSQRLSAVGQKVRKASTFMQHARKASAVPDSAHRASVAPQEQRRTLSPTVERRMSFSRLSTDFRKSAVQAKLGVPAQPSPRETSPEREQGGEEQQQMPPRADSAGFAPPKLLLAPSISLTDLSAAGTGSPTKKELKRNLSSSCLEPVSPGSPTKSLAGPAGFAAKMRRISHRLSKSLTATKLTFARQQQRRRREKDPSVIFRRTGSEDGSDGSSPTPGRGMRRASLEWKDWEEATYAPQHALQRLLQERKLKAERKAEEERRRLALRKFYAGLKLRAGKGKATSPQRVYGRETPDGTPERCQTPISPERSFVQRAKWNRGAADGQKYHWGWPRRPVLPNAPRLTGTQQSDMVSRLGRTPAPPSRPPPNRPQRLPRDRQKEVGTRLCDAALKKQREAAAALRKRFLTPPAWKPAPGQKPGMSTEHQVIHWPLTKAELRNFHDRMSDELHWRQARKEQLMEIWVHDRDDQGSVRRDWRDIATAAKWLSEGHPAEGPLALRMTAEERVAWVCAPSAAGGAAMALAIVAVGPHAAQQAGLQRGRLARGMTLRSMKSISSAGSSTLNSAVGQPAPAVGSTTPVEPKEIVTPRADTDQMTIALKGSSQNDAQS
eukprot:TRINITY_DN8822_c0_g1_i1.p1 TRINITY_DN8822_c0_g1~~TRINITY_DN8822_c0_g1_i1.p1  ORF type:complete len:789 (+),score=133.06 TRINITY_DN8822_c0_g1_i1:85-2367(+)